MPRPAGTRHFSLLDDDHDIDNSNWQTVTVIAENRRFTGPCGSAGQIATALVKGVGKISGSCRIFENLRSWHAACFISINHHTATEFTAMISSAASMNLNPLFLRHDLMIELGRLEMAMQDMRSAAAMDQATAQLQQLESRRARINEALSRLPA